MEFETHPKVHSRNFSVEGIWIIISKPISGITSELREAISKKDFDNFCYLINPRSKAFVKTIDGNIDNKKNNFNRIKRNPVLVDVTYGPKIIARCLFTLPHQNYIFTFVPHNGGNLSPKNFKTYQYFKNGPVNHLDALILIQKPILTKLEKAILQKVPAEVSHSNLGYANNVSINRAVATFVDEKVTAAVSNKINEQTAKSEYHKTQENFNNQQQQQQLRYSQETTVAKLSDQHQNQPDDIYRNKHKTNKRIWQIKEITMNLF